MGSCVLLVRIGDVRNVIERGAELLGDGGDSIKQTLKIVGAIDQLRAVRRKQDQHMNQLEKALLYKLFQPSGNTDYLNSAIQILQNI